MGRPGACEPLAGKLPGKHANPANRLSTHQPGSRQICQKKRLSGAAIGPSLEKRQLVQLARSRRAYAAQAVAECYPRSSFPSSKNPQLQNE